MKVTTIACAILLLAAGRATAQGSDDVALIRDVVDRFATGIVEADSAALASLYAYPEIPFFATLNGISPGGYLPTLNSGMGFVRMITRMGNAEERFTNVVIDEAQGVATMRADYGFYVNGELSNSGKEMWTLVKTREGWKIVSVIWSQ